MGNNIIGIGICKLKLEIKTGRNSEEMNFIIGTANPSKMMGSLIQMGIILVFAFIAVVCICIEFFYKNIQSDVRKLKFLTRVCLILSILAIFFLPFFF